MDILQPLPFKDWPLLLGLLKTDWPNYACDYNWLLNAIKWKKAAPDIAYKVYCPEGDYRSGTFVGMSLIGHEHTGIIIFTLDKGGDLLKKALEETQEIDWLREEGIIFYMVHEHLKPILQSVVTEKQKKIDFKFSFDCTCDYYYKFKEENAVGELDPIPDGFELKPLRSSDVPLINSVWPHRQEGSQDNAYFQASVRLNTCLGIYDTRNNYALAAWCMHSYYGSIQALQTLDKYKRLGLARIIVQNITKRLACDDPPFDTTLFISEGNQASVNLFKSLGYQYVGKVTFGGTID